VRLARRWGCALSFVPSSLAGGRRGGETIPLLYRGARFGTDEVSTARTLAEEEGARSLVATLVWGQKRELKFSFVRVPLELALQSCFRRAAANFVLKPARISVSARG
jgi:hypothetical protein